MSLHHNPNAETKASSRTVVMVGLIATVLTTCSVFALSARKDASVREALAKSSSPSPSPTPTKAKPIPGDPLAQGEHVEWLHITLTPRGFEPSDISLLSGKFLLAIDKRIGPQGLLIRLNRSTGNSQHSIDLPLSKLYAREIIELHPGRYSLTVDGNAEWVCSLTVSNR